MSDGKDEATNDLEYPPPACIAAGFFHSFVLGRNHGDAGPNGLDVSATDRHGTNLQSDSTGASAVTVYSFGENKNYALGIDEDLGSDSSSVDKKLIRFNKKGITQLVPEAMVVGSMAGREVFHISCGGHHTAYLEKRANQAGGQVYTLGLGTNGRLGVPMPKSIEEFEQMIGGEEKFTEQFSKEKGKVKFPKWTTAEHYRTCKERLWHGGGYHAHHKKWTSPYPIWVKFGTTDKMAYIDCGADHTLAITAKGAVWAWGLGTFGQLGDGHTLDRDEPVLLSIPGGAQIRMVAAGSKHSLALSSSGHIFSWGQGDNGRLGQGKSMKAALQPTAIESTGPEKNKVHMRWIAAGEAHSGSVDLNGNVWAWGAGSYGRLGFGEEDDSPDPKKVSSLAAHPCTQIALGTLHSLALTSKGEVYGWGSGVATGCMSPTAQGAIQPTPKPVGFNYKPQTGDMTWIKDHKDRSLVILQIAAGNFHSMALQDGGRVYTWGAGANGRLGHCPEVEGMEDDESPFKLTPSCIPIDVLLRVEFNDDQGQHESLEKINAWNPKERTEGKQEKGALKDDGSVEKPAQIIFTCGGNHSAMIDKKLQLFTWGCGEYGQHGQEMNDDLDIPASIRLPDLPKLKIIMVALGLEHCLAIAETTELLAWGRNHCGQLGFGTTKNTNQMAVVHGVVDVVSIAAGEDHSAACTANGSLFTWGSADSGKLGHGTSMKTGQVQVPRQVAMNAPVERACCGVQHTAVIAKNKKLHTFGAGWFGRLGHGDMRNQYSPKLVETFIKMYGTSEETVEVGPIKDVQCAAYHTVVLTPDGKVWTCGRDQMVLNSDHQDCFTMFEQLPDDDDCEPNIIAIAAAGKHTLVLADDGTIFAWGENKENQLGLGEHIQLKSKPLIQAPKTVETDDAIRLSERRMNRGRKGLPPIKLTVTGIATGPSHSIAMLSNDELLSWGLRSGGRTGIVGDRHEDPPIGKYLYKPRQVKGDWWGGTGAEDEDGGYVVEEDAAPAIEDKAAEDEDEEGHHDEHLMDISTLQAKFKKEKAEFKQSELAAREEKLVRNYSEYKDDIFELWDKPEVKDGVKVKNCEWRLRELQSTLDRSVCRNLQRMSLGEIYPSLANLNINQEVARKLIHYEELINMLQQQPCYLARLGDKLEVGEDYHTKGKSTERNIVDIEVNIQSSLFPRICLSIFKDMEDDRTRHLYMALVRRMAINEIHSKDTMQKSIDTIFTAQRSFVYSIVGSHILHPYFREFFRVLFDMKEKDSLINLIEMWTTRPKKKPPTNMEEAAYVAAEDTPADAIFAMNENDIMDLESSTKKGRKIKTSSGEQMDKIRTQLQDYHRTFGQFLNCGDGIASKKVIDKKTPPSNFCEFIDRFIEQRSHQKCMQCMWKILKKSQEVLIEHLNKDQTRTDETDEERKKRVNEPLIRLFLGAIFGHVLEHHQQIMGADQFKLLQAACAKKTEDENVDERSSQFKDKVVEKQMKVHFNISMLGKFLKMAAVNTSNTESGLNPTLITFAQHVKNGPITKLIDIRMVPDDNTETLLTIDLYSSHYDLDEHHVMLPTADLLNISNALWLYQDDVVALPRNEMIKDSLYQCLLELQPDVMEEYKGFDEKTETDRNNWKLHRCWGRHIIDEVDFHNQTHNLCVFPRFLEHQRDLCFCRECEAPINRGMAPHNQRKATEMRLLKTYRPLEPRNPSNPTVPPPWTQIFWELQDLLGNPELPKVKSKEFLLLRFDFEEFQKNIIDELRDKPAENRTPEDYALVAQIDKGKKNLDALKPLIGHSPEKKFIEFVNESFEHRAAHYRYLEAVEKGLKDIKDSQEKYKTRLEVMIATLEKAVECSEQLKVPRSIRDKASDKGVSLKFVDLKNKTRRHTDNGQASAQTVPSASYSLYWLRHKGVIARMGRGEGRMDIKQYKYISFSFSYEDSGDWNITSLHCSDGKQYMLFKFEIKPGELEKMKRAGKTAKMSYNDGFVVINCFNLLQLLARIAAAAY